MKSLSEVVSRGVGRSSLTLQANSPKLLFAGGVVGMVGSTVLACRATLKMEQILDSAHHDREVANSIDNPEYSDSDLRKDLTLITVRTGGKIAAQYAPAVIIGGISIAMLTKSHNILQERNVALMAAYTALDKGFNEYRNRVIAKYGEDVDREFRYDTEMVEIEDEKGKKKKELRGKPGVASPYARFFDEYSPNWSKDPDVNRIFISCQQNFANDLLHSRGHLFLNEVYGMLGLPHTTPGSVVGWISGGEGDNYVDFGVFVNDGSDRIRDFVNGREGSVLLDFNVDGVIYDQIGDPGEAVSWQLGR